MGYNKKVPETKQLSMIPEIEKSDKNESYPISHKRFRKGEPESIFIGDKSLKNYLLEMKKSWVIAFRERIFEQNIDMFIDKYSNKGRRPFHPFVILGLILYGAQMGRWSLRELEDLAKLDLGAWWICGGLQPDHSTIGDFIHRHKDVLSEDFFISLSSNLVKRLGISHGLVAGDGTVVEAASSRFSMLKREAAEEALRKNREQTGKNSIESKASEKVLETIVEREKKHKQKGNKAFAKACPQEPEAVLQPRKDGVKRPGYKPSILADRNRMILGQDVEASSEVAAVDPMLGQYLDITGALPRQSLWDGSYEAFEFLELAVSLDLDVFCQASNKSGNRKYFSKTDFHYNEKRDVYICPANKILSYRKSGHSQSGRFYREYQCKDCEACNCRAGCTKSKYGRSVLRYEGEELKEAMREVIKQKTPQRLFPYRKAFVEPLFGDLRYRQGLSRFHRKGLLNVRVEFSLHCMSYTLRRSIRLESRQNCLYLCFFGLFEDKKGVFGCQISILGTFSLVTVIITMKGK